MWMTYLQDGVLADQNLNREQSAWESEVSTLHQEKGSTESYLIMQYSLQVKRARWSPARYFGK